MSALTQELPKDVAIAWRRFLATPEGQFGVDWARRNGPSARGTTPTEMLESALKWAGYQEAFDIVEDVLTALPQKPQSLDEEPLGNG